LLVNKTHIKKILTPTIFLVLLIVFFKKTSIAQQYREGNFGINVGVVLALGTHFDRFGVSLNSYYQKGNVQLNPTLKFYFNAKNLGSNQQYVEGVASLGVVYGYGTKDTNINYFYTPVGNQTLQKNSVGYAYNYYFNTIKTSQFTGTISIQVSDFNFIAENDLFSGTPSLDRFRTGAFLFQYQKDKFLYGINTTLFTGQMGQRVTDESYPFGHIYENTIGGRYTEFSNGLLSAQVQYAGAYYQTYQGNIGVDSERIRHAVQNRFAHDFLIGHGINAHVPMLDINGNQYLFKDGQKIKPMKFYFNGFSNPSIFY